MNINEILNISNLKDYKVHLATSKKGKHIPLFEFQKGKFEQWQSYQNQKNFERSFILSLIYFSKGEWLFGGIYESLEVKKVKDHYEYQTKLSDKGKSLIGRLVIDFKRDFRQSYLKLENYIDEFNVLEVKKTPAFTNIFPGWKNVLIPFDNLKLIIEKDEVSWKTALGNLKGIYLITDTSNGKLYVGKASGSSAIWSRWSEYIHDGHGGNKKLRAIIKKEGVEYAQKYFQFTLLEVTEFNPDDDIDERESFWKNVLKSREFGYNDN